MQKSHINRIASTLCFKIYNSYRIEIKPVRALLSLTTAENGERREIRPTERESGAGHMAPEQN